MIQITNKTRSPIPLTLLSLSKKRLASKCLTTKILAGIGRGKNTTTIEDEQYTEMLGRLEKAGMITMKRI